MDQHLTRVGFMDPRDVGRFVRSLVGLTGLELIEDGEFCDIAVVDQHTGPTARAPWLECGTDEFGVSMSWLAGTEPGTLAVPVGWSIEQYRSMQFAPGGHRAGLPVSSRPGMDEYLNPSTGNVNYVGRRYPDQQLRETLHRQAREAEQLGHLSEACRLYRQLTELEPSHAGAWYSLAVITQKLDGTRASVPLYRRAIELDENLQVAHANLGAALSELKDPTALDQLLRAVSLNPADAVTLWNLAAEQERQGTRSIDSYRKFIQAAGKDPAASWSHHIAFAEEQVAGAKPEGAASKPDPRRRRLRFLRRRATG